MLEKENLTPFQIQLLLYYLTAEPSKRTVTDSARSLNVSKWVVTRTLDTLEKLNIVERLENRKTVLTVPGVKLAEKYQKQRKVLEKYMQYQDIPPAQIKENALRALAAGFSDEFMERLAEQESRMHIKEIFAGRRDFHGGDICNYLSDGGIDGRYVFFPVTALRFISMGKGRDTLLHGSVCLKMQCSVGDMHMPESTAVFTMFIH